MRRHGNAGRTCCAARVCMGAAGPWSTRIGHAAASGSFSILRFAERDLPDIVYIEQLTSAVYLDQRPDVEHYLEVVHQLSGEAMTPAASTRFIEQVARETWKAPR